MPINLDSCITGIFVPGNIGASSGLPPVVRVVPDAEGPKLPVITSEADDANIENMSLAHTLTADEAVTWLIAGGADAALFEISGSTLRWLADGTQDFEAPADADTDNVYEVTVRAVNAAIFSSDQAITITVTDVDESPIITSSDTLSNLESTVLAHTLTADQVVTWSIVGGSDAAKFEISGSTLRWLGNGTQDFETPADADLDNVYEVTVRAVNASLLDTDQNITVTVTDVAEVPTGFADSAMLVGPVMVNGDGTSRQAYVDGVMVNL